MPRPRGARICKGLKCPKCAREDLYRRSEARGVQRFKCDEKLGGCGWHGTKPVGLEAFESNGIDRKQADALHRKVRDERGVRRYVITAAQNATPVHKRFFKALLNYCSWTGAQLIVIPYRYKNPTSMWTERAKSDDWWALELGPYLLDKRIELNKNLVLLADVKTQPTASAPLQGFETMTGSRSAIVGHPKLELVTVPTPQERLPKIITTTGAVTKRNYIPSKAGKKGEFHHTFGACVVELEGGLFHMRQINAVKDGTFCDLEYEYGPDFRRPAQVEALVMGDTHVWFVDPDVVRATFGPGGIVPSLRPKKLVWHDVMDFYSRNHHHRGRVFINYVKHHEGRDNVEQEVNETFAFIDRNTPPGTTNVIVHSNHPAALSRWIEETDPRTDPENCVFWARTFEAMCMRSKMTETGAATIDPFAWWGKQKLKCADRTIFLAQDQTYLICGIDVSNHGHYGPSGVRGNIKAFGKVGVKLVIAHGHAPGIKDGVYQAGTNSLLKLEFVRGPSAWLHTDVLIYPNGKRTLINVIDGKWRLPARAQLKEAA